MLAFAMNSLAEVHLPRAIADLLPDGFIWTPFLPDLDQAGLESRYTFPEPWPICFRIASFGHLSCQIWFKPFLSPDTPSQSHGRFASRLLHLDTLPPKTGSIHSGTQIHIPRAMADVLPDGFTWTPFCPDLGQAILEPRYTFPEPWQSICKFQTSCMGLLKRISCCAAASLDLQDGITFGK